MALIKLHVNKKTFTVDIDPDTPLLWVLRDTLGLTGTKYSCGIGVCGSCAVHIDEEAVRSCTVTAAFSEGKQVTTIEGLALDKNHPLFKAWLDEEVSQCGYCQPGQIMTAASLLKKKKKPSKEEINGVMSEVLCRCGTYPRIAKAIDKVIEEGGMK